MTTETLESHTKRSDSDVIRVGMLGFGTVGTGAYRMLQDNREAMERLVEALLEHESLDSAQMRRVIAGLPIDGGEPEKITTDDDGTPETEEQKSRFKKPILPPITPNNPATA